MRSYRTKEAQKRYTDYMEEKNADRRDVCELCTRPALRQFENWKVIENQFPYDLIATTHDMLIPLRHTDEAGLTVEEQEEFKQIKPDLLDSSYDVLIEMAHRNKSVPGHFHVHLIVGDDTYPALGTFDSQ